MARWGVSLMLAGGLGVLPWAAQVSGSAADDGRSAASPMSAGASSSAPDSPPSPIDCPLRRLGIDPSHLRPFEDVEKYVAFLEREDRAAWQKPDDVVAALGLSGRETVFDLGAGSGYFTFRFARALPAGKVIAADVEPEMIRHIHHRAGTESVTNVELQLIRLDDPAVPRAADLVFVCDVLHHVRDRDAWLGRIAGGMRPGARLALIEFREGELPEGPPAAVKVTKAAILDLANRAGLEIVSDHADVLPYQVLLVFRKP